MARARLGCCIAHSPASQERSSGTAEPGVESGPRDSASVTGILRLHPIFEPTNMRFQRPRRRHVYSHAVGMAKSDPEIDMVACRRLDVDPTRTIFVDDAQIAVDGAAAVGMTTVLHHDTPLHHRPPRHLAHMIVHTNRSIERPSGVHGSRRIVRRRASRL